MKADEDRRRVITIDLTETGETIVRITGTLGTIEIGTNGTSGHEETVIRRESITSRHIIIEIRTPEVERVIETNSI